MNAPTTLLDPTAESSPAGRSLSARPASLEGLTVGLLDISKSRGDVFLDRLDALLSERGIEVKRYRKPTFARIAPTELKQLIASECDVLVEGLAD
ncbi:hypothetical protein SAMN05216421_0943 [Halopseudomonas xinjiangensis]|uniref:UGSC-like domain-containing protein n=3 Tax=Halopseudomonas xinjiangensis TaxID=487184 RepID=A0A1H1PL81_9GAMM|nr:hypothetical protein [Halopseudomonas xinjiangensis]SDS12021.1 hypothetical protein SAMN05216421_0943 [Halopseudomonas xinjiangensis]